MNNWNPQGMSESFLRTAESADRYLTELQQKVKDNPNYHMIYDEHLAKFFVYNYLHGRTFLETKELFLKEIEKMIKEGPTMPSNIFDKDRFLNYWESFLNEIKTQYS